MTKATIALSFAVCFAIHIFAATDSAKLLLNQENRCRPGGFAPDAFVEIQWAEELPLVVDGWKMGDNPMFVAAQLEIVDERGAVVPQLPTTGPGPEFRTSATVKHGEKCTFRIWWTCGFAVTRSGTYSAKGVLWGASSGGKPVTIEVDKVSFHVTTEDAETMTTDPNQTSEGKRQGKT